MIEKVKHLVRVVDDAARSEEGAMKLNDIRDNDGATKDRMRVGRGIGSGKGKTGGPRREGSEGPHRRRHQGLRGRPDAAPPPPAEARLHATPNARDLNEVNLGRIQEAVDGRQARPGRAGHGRGARRRGRASRKPRDGVKILGVGELTAKLAFEVAGASKSAQRRDREGRRLGHDPRRRCGSVTA